MAIGRSVGGIVGMCIGLYVFSATFPGALTAINAANTSGWTDAQIALWPIIGIIAIVAGLAMMLPDQL